MEGKRVTNFICILLSIFVFTSLTTGCKSKAGTTTETKGTQKKTTSKQTGTASKTLGKTTATISTNSNIGEELSKEDTDGAVQNENEASNGEEQLNEDIFDLNGRTLVFFRWQVDPFAKTEANMANPDFVRMITAKEKVEIKYNCKIEADYSTPSYTASLTRVVNDMMAGVATWDFAQTYTQNTFPLIKHGFYINVGEILKDYPDAYKNLLLDVTTIWKGNHYGLSLGTYLNRYAIFYNRGLLEREAIPDINNYYVKEDQWTWDSFLDVAIKATRDLNGDGISDQWGFNDYSNRVGAMLIASNGASPVVYRGGDNYELTLNDPKTVKALNFLSDMYNIYKVTPASGVINIKTNYDTLAMSMSTSSALMQYFFTPYGTWKGINWGVAYLPKGPDASEYSTGLMNNTFFYSFPTYIREPEKVIRVIAEWLYEYRKDEGITALEKANMWAEFPEDREVLMKLMTELPPPIYNNTTAFGNFESIMNSSVYAKVIGRELTAIAAIEKVVPQLQSLIDSIN